MTTDGEKRIPWSKRKPHVSNATPRPWKMHNTRRLVAWGVDSEAGDVCEISSDDDSAEADANLIVLAVNAHDGLLASLREFIAAHDRDQAWPTATSVEAARAALAKGTPCKTQD